MESNVSAMVSEDDSLTDSASGKIKVAKIASPAPVKAVVIKPKVSVVSPKTSLGLTSTTPKEYGDIKNIPFPKSGGILKISKVPSPEVENNTNTQPDLKKNVHS